MRGLFSLLLTCCLWNAESQLLCSTEFFIQDTHHKRYSIFAAVFHMHAAVGTSVKLLLQHSSGLHLKILHLIICLLERSVKLLLQHSSDLHLKFLHFDIKSGTRITNGAAFLSWCLHIMLFFTCMCVNASAGQAVPHQCAVPSGPETL